jgi:hypothetical protein
MPDLPVNAAGAIPHICHGADEIGAFLFPNEPKKRRRRRVYHLVSEVPEADRLPVFKLGGVICARPATLLAWIAARERLTGAEAAWHAGAKMGESALNWGAGRRRCGGTVAFARKCRVGQRDEYSKKS